ncbi:amidohydrolase [Geminicoccus harenae]|uniref:amidohydrolase n=1 Tax=Geminicoccus harenae TaxID=2498453 RepID=UPI00168A524A|nr:amidohydrolase [Geminicoccus harenae]
MAVHATLPVLALSLSLGAGVALPALCWAPPVLAQEQAPAGQGSLPGPSDELLAQIESAYKDIHANPELGMQEHRTAGIAADWLRQHGYEVTEGVGVTGVVGLLRNGEGPTVLLRADMDALAMKENTGLPYASEKVVTDPSGQQTPVAHSCGHDMHVAWLMGATQVLAEHRDKWQGTVMALFQPAEETGEGARAMIRDGMVERFPKPDIVLGQHVMPMPAGRIGTRTGLLLSMSDSMEVKLFGRGGHGSSPESTIDPVVMAAASVMRLQTVVSRELSITDSAVVTVGALQSGNIGNIIPEEALLRLNIRTFDEEVRETVLTSIKRIINAEAAASDAPKPPAFTMGTRFPPTYNDEEATLRVVDAFKSRFGGDQVQEIIPASASEDFTVFARAWNVPSVYWAVGGTDPQMVAEAEQAGRPIPSNHSPEFAPVLDPTLRVGVEAMLAAAGVWLAPTGTQP